MSESTRTPGPVSTDGAFIDIVLLLGPWRPVDLLPQGDVANGPLVNEIVFSVDRYTRLPAAPSGPLCFAAHGNTEELGDYLEYCSNVRLVSDRFRRLLEDFGQQDVQFFPAEIETGPSLDARVQRHGGGPVVKFWWMHHWRCHDLVDVERSEVTYSRHIPPLPNDQSNFDIDRSERLILRSPPPGEGLYGLNRWPRRRLVTPALAARIREAGLRVSLGPRALSPPAREAFSTGLGHALHYLPNP